MTNASSDQAKQLTAQQALDWIRAHPSVLIDHPELLTILQWPTESGVREGATSLADFQARRLRQELKKLQDQLKALTQNALDNEALMHQLHRMTLELMTIVSLDEFIDALIGKLKSEFKADAIQLHLNTIPEAIVGIEEVIQLDDTSLDWWLSQDHSTKPQCGRFTQSKLQTLFPKTDARIQSAAAVPMAHMGLLTIGSEDQSKFQPHMGTLFLELLAATIAHRLGHTPPPARG